MWPTVRNTTAVTESKKNSASKKKPAAESTRVKKFPSEETKSWRITTTSARPRAAAIATHGTWKRFSLAKPVGIRRSRPMANRARVRI